MPDIIRDRVTESTTSTITSPIFLTPSRYLRAPNLGLILKARFLPTYSVVDIFAGPGGLAEGFSNVRDEDGERPFHIALSVEKDAAAHSTLTFRAFLRQFGDDFPSPYYDFLNGMGAEPNWAELYPEQWSAAQSEAWKHELATGGSTDELDNRIDLIRKRSDGDTILIGGPPCQAYSLVGRARNAGVRGYVRQEDKRHFLYQEYIRILDRLRPAAFVMENVKGMLSSSVDGQNLIFDQVLEDLRGNERGAQRYRLIALAPHRAASGDSLEPKAPDFVIRAEDFGVPQARHRVIVIGLREDLACALPEDFLAGSLTRESTRSTVDHVLDEMPELRSGLSRSVDSDAAWKEAVVSAMSRVEALSVDLPGDNQRVFTKLAAQHRKRLQSAKIIPPRVGEGHGISADCPSDLRNWIVDEQIQVLPNHQTRGHMESDLERYFFAAIFAEVEGRSPKASEFPAALAPQHRNWASGKFADRFRVQVRGTPSTTVTSHISKDGHYFIHPDPFQCRSLSVREAARLQTFPDNYLFKGNRTQQYTQVGNAVPPLLAKKIGQALLRILKDCGNRSKDRVSTASELA